MGIPVIVILGVCAHAEAAWDNSSLSAAEWEHMLVPRQRSDRCSAAKRTGLEFTKRVFRDAHEQLEVQCPTTTRVGGTMTSVTAGRGKGRRQESYEDGTKSVCITKDLGKSGCVIYSLGSALDFTFEAAMSNRFKSCRGYTFDCTVGIPNATLLPPRWHFHPWCISSTDFEGKSPELTSFTKKGGVPTAILENQNSVAQFFFVGNCYEVAWA